MADALETSLRALAHWLSSNNVEPDKLNVVLRAKDEMTRARLNMALDRWSQDLKIYQFSDASLQNVAPFKFCGLKISVGSLDHSGMLTAP